MYHTHRVVLAKIIPVLEQKTIYTIYYLYND